MASIPIVKTRLKQPYISAICVHCKAEVEYTLSGTSITSEQPFSLQCIQCKETWIIKPKVKAGKRRIGSDERPIDMDFYNVLGLPSSCTPEDIKKAYRRLAIKHHPDKNPGDPTAGEKFKEIAIAYATLSDPDSRHSYNEFGKGKGDGQSEESMVDPEAMFSQLFGGERFQDIIGTIALGSDMKAAMQDNDEEEEEDTSITTSTPTTVTLNSKGRPIKPVLTPEELEIVAKKKAAKDAAEKKISDEKARVRELRVVALMERLNKKLSLFTELARGEDDEQVSTGVRTMWTIEAEELKQESYGVELLQAVGFVYTSKSSHYLASTGPIPFGLGGWFHSAKSTVHIVSETVSTVRSAYALKEVFEALSTAEKSGLPDDKKKELEDKAAQMGLKALFKGAKLEVESVIREVCDRILSEENVPVPELRKRAVAIGILGEVFEKVKKDENSNPPLAPPPTAASSASKSTSTATPPKSTPGSTPPPSAGAYRAGPTGTGSLPRTSKPGTEGLKGPLW